MALRKNIKPSLIVIIIKIRWLHEKMYTIFNRKCECFIYKIIFYIQDELYKKIFTEC